MTDLTLNDLLEIETIRRLRIRYSYYLDVGDLDSLVDLFTDDAICEFGPFGVWKGQATIRENYQKVVGGVLKNGPFQTLHANTNHWVELTGPDTAVGRLYLIDLMLTRAPEANPLVWLGVYDEAYCRSETGWRISRSSLQFLWPERHVTAGFPTPMPSGDRA